MGKSGNYFFLYFTGREAARCGPWMTGARTTGIIWFLGVVKATLTLPSAEQTLWCHPLDAASVPKIIHWVALHLVHISVSETITCMMSVQLMSLPGHEVLYGSLPRPWTTADTGKDLVLCRHMCRWRKMLQIAGISLLFRLLPLICLGRLHSSCLISDVSGKSAGHAVQPGLVYMRSFFC